jgi:branched-chain amino acid transport system permease protein
MSWRELIQQIVNALSLGSIYALLALGLSVVYGVMGILNFAFGDLVTITGYTMYFVSRGNTSFLVMAMAGIAMATLSSVGMDLIAFRPLRRASFLTLLFTSFALSQIIQNLFRQVVSPRPKGVPVPDLFNEAVQIGSISIGVLPLITAVVGFASLLVLTLFMRRSRSGLSMRAAAQDFQTARLMGIRANRVTSLAFAISGLLAGIAGVFWIARLTSVSPSMGFTPILQAFIASVIGGLGNLTGAVVGGFFLGALEVFLQATLPSGLLPFAEALTLVAIVAILYVRPQGLLGQASEAI